ncbi:SAM-dependent methyltransferase [Nocardia alni]|uniref:SAM-dependent methyltransferase n=1 Tax=Nocardia alni TaxID=2815723 RepID=UPI001C23995F|nr:SAM-dependent methyltransferase [Nocardia alni]
MADVGGVDIRQDRAHSARIYDYFLGGQDNYAVDKQAAEAIERAIPSVRAVARGNREFMGRAISHVSGLGVRQFLDVGTGIPTEPNLHQIAQETNPAARVVYVDNDPIVLAHARALLVGTPEGRTQYVQADLTRPQDILESEEVRETLDFAEPVALSLIAIGHFVPGERIYEIVDTLLAPLARGSFLVMTHLTTDFDPEMVEGTVAAYRGSGIEMQARTHDGVARFFDGLEVLDPGIVAIEKWYPGGVEPAPEPGVSRLPTAAQPPAAGYAAVGRKV